MGHARKILIVLLWLKGNGTAKSMVGWLCVCSVNAASLLTVCIHTHTPRLPSQQRLLERRGEKVKCLLHYLLRAISADPAVTPRGAVTFTRRCLGDRAPDWAHSRRSFDQMRVHITADGRIEDVGQDAIQVWSRSVANQLPT